MVRAERLLQVFMLPTDVVAHLCDGLVAAVLLAVAKAEIDVGSLDGMLAGIVLPSGEVVDRINRMHGSETIVIGAQQYTQKDGKGKADVFANAIKHNFKSKNPTTRWADIIKLH